MSAKKTKKVESIKARCASGVEGLDQILAGGLPEKCFYLIQGDPGSGKTTLALQFLLEGKRNGESVFYITLSETRSELLTVARSHGWSLEGIELMEMSSVEKLLAPEEQASVFHSSEIELNKVSQLLVEKIREAKPTRLVFDSLSEFRLLAETPLRYRRQVMAFKRVFAELDCTVLLLDDRASGTDGDPHILSLSHGVVQMEQLSPDYGAARRRLRIVKMRGVKYFEGFHDYAIVTGGVHVFPRLVAANHRGDLPHESVSSGIAEIDALFGGGLDRGTTSLFLGPAGCGKSSLALQHVNHALKCGDRAMVFTFDETLGILLARTNGLGMNLEKYMKSGQLVLQQVDPAELSPGEFAVRVQRGVEGGAKMVMIDSLNGYLNAMPGEKYLNNQLHELCSFLNQQSVVTILVLAQHGLLSFTQSPVDLTYLADTVAHLRFFEVEGKVRQALAVIKKRSGPHEKTIREFLLERGKGVRVGPPLKEFAGVLGGVPMFQGAASQIMNTKPDAAK